MCSTSDTAAAPCLARICGPTYWVQYALLAHGRSPPLSSPFRLLLVRTGTPCAAAPCGPNGSCEAKKDGRYQCKVGASLPLSTVLLLQAVRNRLVQTYTDSSPIAILPSAHAHPCPFPPALWLRHSPNTGPPSTLFLDTQCNKNFLPVNGTCVQDKCKAKPCGRGSCKAANSELGYTCKCTDETTFLNGTCVAKAGGCCGVIPPPYLYCTKFQHNQKLCGLSGLFTAMRLWHW